MPVGTSDATSAPRVAFLAVYEREFTPMLRLAFVTLGSNEMAEDVVHDAFVEVYRRWETIRDPGAYVRRVVVNRCTSALRRRRLERRHVDSTRQHEMQWHDADSLCVSDALQQLSVRQRAAMHMRFVEGLSEAAIADTLGCKPGTVKSLLARGRSTMRKALEHDD